MRGSDIVFIEKARMGQIFKIEDILNLSQIAFYHFMNYDDEILYFLNEDRLAGVFSIGDLERFYNSDDDQAEINTQYIFVNKMDCIEVKEFFEHSVTINELPVVTENKELLGIIKNKKMDKLRQKQRFHLRSARTNRWYRKEIERFINHTKAKVILYAFSNDKIISHWNDNTIQILKKRKENKGSDWMGLSDEEWKVFWQGEYEDGMVKRMRSEAEGCDFIVKNGQPVFGDKEGEFYSYKNGYRVTRNNPSHADRRIFFYGPCIIFGAYCKDNQTIEYYLQDNLNEKGYKEWKVINKGICGPENCYNQLFMEKLSPNDIVILWGEPEQLPKKILSQVTLRRDMTTVVMNISSLINYIVDTPIHCNYIVNQKIAEEIFSDFCNTKILDCSRQLHISEEIQNYYISWDVHEYFEEYFNKYNLDKKEENIVVGAIVMNCNPFTKGHRYLIDQAIQKVDKLYIFVVEEDSSFFKFSDRLKMVKEGISDLRNIVVIPSGKYIISKETFAQYFDKEQVTIVDSMDYDIYIFGEIVASKLGIQYRFIGEEPLDRVTKKYNETMKRMLPDFGVKVVEIPRCTFDSEGEEEYISATLVRKALQSKDMNTLEKLCFKHTLKYLDKYMLI